MTSEAPFSADRVGQLEKDGFLINHSRVRLGSGLNTFAKAKDGLQNWRYSMWELGGSSSFCSAAIIAQERN